MPSPPAVVDSDGCVLSPARMPKWAHDRIHILRLQSRGRKTIRDLAGELIVEALKARGFRENDSQTERL